MTFAAFTTSTFVGSPVTVTATVTPPVVGYATPTGTVTFFSNVNHQGGPNLATVDLVANGDGTATASFTTSSLAVGSTYVSPEYNGDGYYRAQGSATGADIAVAAISVPPPVTVTLGKTSLPTTGAC